ncbi:MAG: response regulator [Burkholderiaceae bacterium]|nr:response regulator transcription factor [Oxalobacteraceae bacterium]
MSAFGFPKPCRVMVVEDDLVTRRLLCLAIEREPSLILCAAVGTVREARDYLAQCSIDLLLTDLGLPDGSGVSVIRHCRHLRPRADILVITMSSEEEQILACIEAGAAGYVLKESLQLKILDAIIDLRAGGSPISPMVARKVLTCMRGVTRTAEDAGEGESTLLTRREFSILDSISRGGSYAKVAEALGLSIGTVQTHIKNVYAKLGVHSRTEAIIEAQRLGLISIHPRRI